MEKNEYLSEIFNELRSDAHASVESVTEELSGLIKNELDQFQFGGLRELSIFTADIEYLLGWLEQQYRVSNRYGSRELPCYMINETPIPVSIPSFNSFIDKTDVELDGIRKCNWEKFNEIWYREVQEDEQAKLINADDAVDNSIAELTEFMKGRLAAKKYFDRFGVDHAMVGPPSRPVVGDQSAVAMLSVEVHSKTPGERVSYSPAYFINYMVLAAPTTPVTGYLLPGRFVFMVSNSVVSKKDPGVFDVPPHYTINLMV